MKQRRVHLSLAPVERRYEPGYPPALAPEEFAALIAERNTLRVRRIVATACAALGLSCTQGEQHASAAPAPSGNEQREARVLEILQAFAQSRGGCSTSFWNSTMRAQPVGEAGTEDVYLPEIPICFGSSLMGVFDTGTARKLALELFRAYGLELEADAALDTAGVHARFDGLDRARSIGIKLRPATRRDPLGGSAPVEAERERLDPDEVRVLRQANWKLHVASADRYELMDRDELTPTLAYLSGVIEFLNSVTDGPDLDVRSILMGDRQLFEVDGERELGLVRSDALTTQGDEGYQDFELAQARTLTLRFPRPGTGAPELRSRSGWGSQQRQDQPAPSTPLSTAGRISALTLPVQALGYEVGAGGAVRPSVLVRSRLVQTREAGAAPLVLETRGAFAFTPSAFDAARPFELEFELPAGRYRLFRKLSISSLRP